MATFNFTTDENPLTSPWLSVGAFPLPQATSGAAAAVTGGAEHFARYGDSSETYSEVTISAAGGRDGGPCLHLTSGGDGYVCTNYDSSAIYIFRLTGGSFAGPLAQAAGAYQNGDKIAIYRDGNDIVVSVNGSEHARASNETTHTGGNPGFFVYDADIRLDDWTDGADAPPVVSTINNLTLLGVG